MRLFFLLWNSILTTISTYLGFTNIEFDPRMPTVGLLSHTGQVGAHFLHYLAEAHAKGDLNLVVLYREGSNLSSIPEGVEKRVVQLDEGGTEVNKKAVAGIEVVVSAISREARLAQIHLIDALSTSSTIKLLIPSDYDLDWRPEGSKAPAPGALEVKEKVYAAAKAKGVPTVKILGGLFDNYFFDEKITGTDIQNNTIHLFRDALHKPIRLLTLEYFGHAISQLVLKPSKLVDGDVQLYDHAPTGQELVEVLSKIHGQRPNVIPYTEEEYQRAVESGENAVGAGIHRKWGEDDWGSGKKVEVDGWKGESTEDLTRRWLESP